MWCFPIFLYLSSHCYCDHSIDLELRVTDENVLCYLPNPTIVVADPSGFHMPVSQGRGQLDKESPSVRGKGTAPH